MAPKKDTLVHRERKKFKSPGAGKSTAQMDLSQLVEGCQCTCAPIYMTHTHPELILTLELVSQ